MLGDIIDFLKQVDELSTAKILLDTMSKYASNITEYDTLAKSYMDIKEYLLAIKYAEKTLVNAPTNEQMYACRANLSKLYNHINDPVSSLRYSTINNKLNPTDYDPTMEQVFSYFLLNQKDKSEQILRDLILKDNLPIDLVNRIKFNLGTYDLYAGKFKQGLRGFILEGKKLGIWKNVTVPFKFWEGGIQPGKTIVILAEGGIGDEIINIRFVTKLQELGMHPIWYTNRSELVNIFKRHGIDARSSLQSISPDSLWTYSMSLPIYLDLDVNDLWNGTYLTADPEYLKKWKWIYGPVVPGSVSVGIRWTGNPAYEHDLHREVPLAGMLDCLQDPKYNIYSIQRDQGADQILKYPGVTDLSNKLETIDDTLAIIHHLDFVVTSCTSVAHMAAAMGKLVYILVPITAYYTWASTFDTSSVWYGDNVKILRQTVHKSWKEPLEQLQKLLK